MTTKNEYEFYGGDFITHVDRKNKIITMYERGGWSRSYDLSFDKLLMYAQQLDIVVDLKQEDKILAEIGTNIILANNAVEHGLDPFQYIPRTEKITDPRDLKLVQQFEKLFTKYNKEAVISLLSKETKDLLK